MRLGGLRRGKGERKERVGVAERLPLCGVALGHRLSTRKGLPPKKKRKKKTRTPEWKCDSGGSLKIRIPSKKLREVTGRQQVKMNGEKDKRQTDRLTNL